MAVPSTGKLHDQAALLLMYGIIGIVSRVALLEALSAATSESTLPLGTGLALPPPMKYQSNPALLLSTIQL